MASREGDAALWLHNKLGSTDDLWSGSSICSQLTRERLNSIQDCFHNLQPHVKVKLMLSFLHLQKRSIEEWKNQLDEILQLAQDDTDQWVAMVGDILRTYPTAGTLNTDVDDHHSFFHECLTDLKKLVKKSHDAGMLPLECPYLSKNAMLAVAGQNPQTVKHFALKRKPKSAALRAELLQKSSEAANNLKRTGGHTLPIKVRSFAKKMDDTTPMKGLPSGRTPGSSGFLKSNSLGSRFGGAPLGQRTSSTPSRREGGIKLLDITEQPVGPKEAKRRKKIADNEALEIQKKEKEAQSNTPDYAAGLMSPAISSLPSPAIAGTSGPKYVPSSGARLPTSAVGGTTTITVPSISVATQQARENLQQQLQSQLTPTNNPARTTVTTVQVNVQPEPTSAAPPQTTQIVTTTASANGQLTTKKGLSLTREQMLEAQEMFRTSNKVTRPEKALILGFMAGSRENPCPAQGDIVNIRLSECAESIQQADGLFRPMIVDTYFQMNYGSGEWKKIKKYRSAELDVE